MTDQSKKQLIGAAWLRLGLVLAAVWVFWWLRRREQPASQQERPVIWRRDIEMGPPAAAEQTAPDVKAGESISTMAQTAVPDMKAGESITMEPAEPAAPPAPKKRAAKTSSKPAAAVDDDLKIIEGIGPKIDAVLKEAGIRTFAALASAEPARLEQILRDARLRLANPETWADQAQLAADGDWAGLEELKGKLKGGRRM